MASLIPNADQEQAGGSQASGPDFRITYHGTVSTLDLFTGAAGHWVEDNVEIEPWQWLGGALCVDIRCACDLINELAAQGFEISL